MSLFGDTVVGILPIMRILPYLDPTRLTIRLTPEELEHMASSYAIPSGVAKELLIEARKEQAHTGSARDIVFQVRMHM